MTAAVEAERTDYGRSTSDRDAQESRTACSLRDTPPFLGSGYRRGSGRYAGCRASRYSRRRTLVFVVLCQFYVRSSTIRIRMLSKANCAFLAAATLAVVAVSGAAILTRSPWCDEGLMTHPAINLYRHGRLVSTTLIPTGFPYIRNIPSVNQYTFWLPPLYLTALAGWMQVGGDSIFWIRCFSAFCSLFLIWAVFQMVKVVSESYAAAMLAAVLVATDYTIILSAVTARPDMMTAALGYCATAVYLLLRPKSVRVAVFCAGTCVACACVTHPMGAVYTGGLILICCAYDWRRLTKSDVAIGILSYLVPFACWGLYVLESPSVFIQQIKAHVGPRTEGLRSPINAILSDFVHRYWNYYAYASAGGLGRFKIVVLIIYLCGFAAAILVRDIRQRPVGRILILLIALYYVEIAVLDSFGWPHYMVHLIPLFAAVLAVVVVWARSHVRLPSAALPVFLTAFIALQLGGHVLKLRANTYATEYVPTIRFLKQRASPQTVIVGGPELAFGLGEGYRLVADARLGVFSHVSPELIVLDPFHPGPSLFERSEPEVAQATKELLANQFHVVATYGIYRILERNSVSADGAQESLPQFHAK
jgi:4-amino-4-deoxy-L-arabinose transferase-like glycosyltransferase